MMSYILERFLLTVACSQIDKKKRWKRRRRRRAGWWEENRHSQEFS